MFAFATEALLKIFDCDIASVVDIKVMEGEDHIGLSDGPASVDCHSQEFCVVDVSIMVEVHASKNLVNLLLRHLKLIESCANFMNLKRSRIIYI